MGKLDSSFSGQIFRKDVAQIIAQNRQLATLMPVRLAYNAAGYPAGQVLARNSTSGFYEKYNDAGASGLDVAKAVLNEEHQVSDFASSGDTTSAVGIFGGQLFKDKLVGLDAAGETDLKSTTIVDSTGVNILKF